MVIGPLVCITRPEVILFTKTRNIKEEVLCRKEMRFSAGAEKSVKYHKKQQKIESGSLGYIESFSTEIDLKVSM